MNPNLSLNCPECQSKLDYQHSTGHTKAIAKDESMPTTKDFHHYRCSGDSCGRCWVWADGALHVDREAAS